MRSHLAIAAMSLLLTGAAAAPAGHGIDVAAMDTSVKPGDDFFDYANGAWLKRTQIPPDQSRWGAFSELREAASKRTADLIAEAAKGNPAAGSNAQKVGDYYASFLDEAVIEKAGLSPLKADLARVAALKNKTELAHIIGETLRADVDVMNATNLYTENLFGLWTSPGLKDADHYTAYLLQGGLGMPDREYYLSPNAKMADTRNAYASHVAAVLKLAGVTNPDARATRVIALEHKIAEAHVSREDSEDVHKGNNPWSAAYFPKKAPGLDWPAFFDSAGLAHAGTIIVWQPHGVIGISAAVGDTPLDVWKDYLTYHLVNRVSGYLPKAFADERFAFYGKELSGTPKQRERWKRAVDATSFALGDAVGQLYAKRYFTPQAKASAEKMVANIKAAFARRIDALAWMSAATKAKAKEKVAGLYVGIGYPEKWIDYSDLKVARGDAFGNFRRAELFELHRQESRLGKPVDRSEWAMTPQTVNAVNLPLQNALNFPAAILDRPFFDAEAPDVYNYGAIGTVIGHEISHSFDDQGSQFDARGRLVNWWTPTDFAHFKDAANRLAKQFDAYAPFPDLHVKGQQTLSENIADVGGLSASFDAWRESVSGKQEAKVNGFTGTQAFFLAYAQSRQDKPRDAALRQQILTDGHAPSRYRTDSVRNIDGWYDAFDVKPGEALYLAPDARVRVW
jgi:predicted metalloendopeptidase